MEKNSGNQPLSQSVVPLGLFIAPLVVFAEVSIRTEGGSIVKDRFDDERNFEAQHRLQ